MAQLQGNTTTICTVHSTCPSKHSYLTTQLRKFMNINSCLTSNTANTLLSLVNTNMVWNDFKECNTDTHCECTNTGKVQTTGIMVSNVCHITSRSGCTKFSGRSVFVGQSVLAIMLLRTFSGACALWFCQFSSCICLLSSLSHVFACKNSVYFLDSTAYDGIIHHCTVPAVWLCAQRMGHHISVSTALVCLSCHSLAFRVILSCSTS